MLQLIIQLFFLNSANATPVCEPTLVPSSITAVVDTCRGIKQSPMFKKQCKGIPDSDLILCSGEAGKPDIKKSCSWQVYQSFIESIKAMFVDMPILAAKLTYELLKNTYDADSEHPPIPFTAIVVGGVVSPNAKKILLDSLESKVDLYSEMFVTWVDSTYKKSKCLNQKAKLRIACKFAADLLMPPVAFFGILKKLMLVKKGKLKFEDIDESAIVNAKYGKLEPNFSDYNTIKDKFGQQTADAFATNEKRLIDLVNEVTAVPRTIPDTEVRKLYQQYIDSSYDLMLRMGLKVEKQTIKGDTLLGATDVVMPSTHTAIKINESLPESTMGKVIRGVQNKKNKLMQSGGFSEPVINSFYFDPIGVNLAEAKFIPYTRSLKVRSVSDVVGSSGATKDIIYHEARHAVIGDKISKGIKTPHAIRFRADGRGGKVTTDSHYGEYFSAEEIRTYSRGAAYTVGNTIERELKAMISSGGVSKASIEETLKLQRLFVRDNNALVSLHNDAEKNINVALKALISDSVTSSKVITREAGSISHSYRINIVDESRGVNGVLEIPDGQIRGSSVGVSMEDRAAIKSYLVEAKRAYEQERLIVEATKEKLIKLFDQVNKLPVVD